VIAEDYDKDGDLDLFVGGRHQGRSYPYVPMSYLLRNDTKGPDIKFTDVTNSDAQGVGNSGMVTGAVWSDYNNDSWPDLLLVGEWAPMMLFRNDKGILVREIVPAFEKTHGWWSTLYTADIDGDGDDDYLAGNMGENSMFKASAEEPVQMYTADFDQDGRLDPVLCHYIQGTSYPFHSRDQLLAQIPSLSNKFPDYGSYANATIEDIISGSSVENAFETNSYLLASVWVENDNGDFRIHELPGVAQFSFLQGFLHDDFNNDGVKEILAVGNFHPWQPEVGRFDASFGAVLRWSGRTLEVLPQKIFIEDDVRGIGVLKTNFEKRYAVSLNNNWARVYKFSKK